MKVSDCAKISATKSENKFVYNRQAQCPSISQSKEIGYWDSFLFMPNILSQAGEASKGLNFSIFVLFLFLFQIFVLSQESADDVKRKQPYRRRMGSV